MRSSRQVGNPTRRGLIATVALPSTVGAVEGDDAFAARAMALRDAASAGGDQPYGAVVVRGGRIIGAAESRVVRDIDPTAHAELLAIRDATRRIGSRDLSGSILYGSSPACPMCRAAAFWAGISLLRHGPQAEDGGTPRLAP